MMVQANVLATDVSTSPPNSEEQASSTHDQSEGTSIRTESKTVSDANTLSTDDKLEAIAKTLVSMREDQKKIVARLDSLERANGRPDQSRKDRTVWDDLRDDSNQEVIQAPVPVASSSPNRREAIPTIQQIRESAAVQEKVQDRLKQLEALAVSRFESSGTENIHVNNLFKQTKSGRERTGNEGVKRNYVPWPQEFCYIGLERKRVRYDDLTQSQWVAGLTKILGNEKDPSVCSNMSEYLGNLFQDVVDMGFTAAKGCHAVILSQMEEGNLTWAELPKIDSIRRNYVQCKTLYKVSEK